MTKLKNSLLSLGARGTLGKAITFLKRRGLNLVEKKPEIPDARSLAQLSWRHMYQKAVALWHALSASEQQEWESLARPKHMTGFAWFMSQALKPNPGLYLPLQGGTMSGDIDMASHNIFTLPDPTNPQDAATKAFVDAHITALDPHLAEILPVLLKGGNLLHISTNTGWVITVAGSGAGVQEVARNYAKTGVTANSKGQLRITSFLGFSSVGQDINNVNWTKKLYLTFIYCRVGSDTEGIGRLQIKPVITEGALGAKGLGVRADNYALKGESYGTSLGIVDLDTAMVGGRGYLISIVHYPASKIEWYVNGILKGTQSTLANIPSGLLGTPKMVHSIINGATGGVDITAFLLQPKCWNEL